MRKYAIVLNMTDSNLTAARALSRRLRPELFRALADPNRIRLICRLARARRPMTVTEAATCCGVHISGVSRHLAILRRAEVVEAEKEGREVRYRLDSERLVAALQGAAEALACCRDTARCGNENRKGKR